MSSAVLEPPPTPANFSINSILANAGTSSEAAIIPSIQNIVSTISVGCYLDLKKIALHGNIKNKFSIKTLIF